MEVSGEIHKETLEISADILINSRVYSNTFGSLFLSYGLN